LLAVVGLYSVLAYSVEQRTREIGIRIAIGARPGDVRNMVVWQGMRLACLGIVIGMPLALGLTRVLINRIFGIQTWDLPAAASVAVVLSGAALLASYLPSTRATRVNPMETLRS